MLFTQGRCLDLQFPVCSFAFSSVSRSVYDSLHSDCLYECPTSVTSVISVCAVHYGQIDLTVRDLGLHVSEFRMVWILSLMLGTFSIEVISSIALYQKSLEPIRHTYRGSKIYLGIILDQ